jgi:hypothetical protein
MRARLGTEHTQCAYCTSLYSKAYAAHLFTFGGVNAHLGSKHTEVVALQILLHLLMLALLITLRMQTIVSCIYTRAAGCRCFKRGSCQEAFNHGPGPALTCNSDAGDKLCTPFEQAALPFLIMHSTSSLISHYQAGPLFVTVKTAVCLESSPQCRLRPPLT